MEVSEIDGDSCAVLEHAGTCGNKRKRGPQDTSAQLTVGMLAVYIIVAITGGFHSNLFGPALEIEEDGLLRFVGIALGRWEFLSAAEVGCMSHEGFAKLAQHTFKGKSSPGAIVYKTFETIEANENSKERQLDGVSPGSLLQSLLEEVCCYSDAGDGYDGHAPLALPCGMIMRHGVPATC